jgi:hypothetical protein
MLSFTKKRAAWYIDLLRESRLLQEQRCQPLAALEASPGRKRFVVGFFKLLLFAG